MIARTFEARTVMDELAKRLAYYNNSLNIDSFEHMLEDPSDCYKFYWLEAILKNLALHSEQTSFTFAEIIDQMIADAYFTVNEYHLSLGVRFDKNGNNVSGLQRAAERLKQLSGLDNTASEGQVKEAVKKFEDDKQFSDARKQISNMVPYRLLSSFIADKNGKVILDSNSYRKITGYLDDLNHTILLPYTIESANTRMDYRIHLSEDWKQMLLDNYMILMDWIRYKKVQYLQGRNPAVPGIIYKIERQTTNIERRLGAARNLWKEIMKNSSVNDIYLGTGINPDKFDLDHFVPWSYIANNELWDLVPADSNLNSSKSSGLPDWDMYFKPFLKNQYLLYRNVMQSDSINDLFRKCWKDNLLATWAQQELYKPGNSEEQFGNILKDNLHPIWKAAKLQGFPVWGINP